MLAKEGLFIIAIVSAIAVILIAAALITKVFWVYLAAAVGFIFFLFTLYFFRDPARTTPPEAVTNTSVIVAPADGKVVELKTVQEPLYLKGEAIQLSIFLSPLDVHVNRVPVSGEIEYVEYVPGDYLVAWHPKASEKNERSVIGIRSVSGHRVLFKQIAGAVARRIVFHLKPGDQQNAGDRFGVVKFGSRMDVLAPLGTRFIVKQGDRVRAGETIIGYLPDQELESVQGSGR